MAQQLSNTVLEGQIRFIQERINHTENQLSLLCNSFSTYGRKTASLRDKGDDLAKSIKGYAEQAQLNRSTQSALSKFADVVHGVQDYRDAETKRIDANVVNKLTAYNSLCKQARESIKQRMQIQEKERAQRKQLETLKSLAETELQKAKIDTNRTSKLLDQEIDKFERRKIADVKKILQEFVQIQLAYHCKAIELYTKGYNLLGAIDEQKDLEDFRNALRLPSSDSRLDIVQSTSLSDSHGYSSLRELGMSTGGKKSRMRVAESLDSMKVEDYGDSDTESSDEEDLDSSVQKIRTRKRSI